MKMLYKSSIIPSSVHDRQTNAMKRLPSVTIIGRQNTGKSTLFNAVIKEKKAIVDEYSGLTRDVISFAVSYGGKSFILFDTPGLDLPSDAELSEAILGKAEIQMKQSDAVIFLMEYPAPQAFDWKIAERLRKLSVPLLAVVNKMDNTERLENLSYFYEMGFKELFPISALNRKNLNLMLDRLSELMPDKGAAVQNKPDAAVAIVGRPNSGKSTLLNALMGFDRALVSDIPGTTRDPVDDFFSFHGKLIKLIDTAGIRKKSRHSDGIEFYSFKRTVDAIQRCDVAIHLIDAQAGISETDKKISDIIIKEGKPVVLAVNKWDAIEKNHRTFDTLRDRMIFKFYRAEDLPVISISAKNKLRINRLMQQVFALKEKASERIETPLLNKTIENLCASGRLPNTGEKLKIYYAVQTSAAPHKFKLFVNKASLFKKDIIRYFEKGLQKEFNLKGIPIAIQIEGKKERS